MTTIQCVTHFLCVELMATIVVLFYRLAFEFDNQREIVSLELKQILKCSDNELLRTCFQNVLVRELTSLSYFVIYCFRT
jgi:hypothetical protein